MTKTARAVLAVNRIIEQYERDGPQEGQLNRWWASLTDKQREAFDGPEDLGLAVFALMQRRDRGAAA